MSGESYLVKAKRNLEYAEQYRGSHPESAMAAAQVAFGWIALHDRVNGRTEK